MTEAVSGCGRAGDHAWRVRFGFWDELDVLYHSFVPPLKPRTPEQPRDSAAEWAKRIVPHEPSGLLGNPAAVRFLMDISTAESAATNYIISGGPCTGKQAFARLLKQQIQRLDPEKPCRFTSVDASKIDEKEILVRLQALMLRADKDRSSSGAAAVIPPSFLLVERFESVTPSFQQHFLLSEVATSNAKRVFLALLVRPDASKIPEQLRALCSSVHLQPLKPMDVRAKLLAVCSSERIGYHRDALEEMARQCDFKLAPSLEQLRLAFSTHHFLSIENVRKLPQHKLTASRKASSTSISSSPSSDPTGTSAKTELSPSPSDKRPATPPPFPLTIPQLCEPLRRCPKCTLLPPCNHVSLAKMFERVERTRGMYPNRTVGTATVPLCKSFARRGVCSNLQAIGRCRFAHPLDLHEIDTHGLAPRCGTHTLPLPCAHCESVRALAANVADEGKAIASLDKQLQQARKQAADLETERYLFARGQGKAVKWGNAKREADDRRAALDARVLAAKTAVDRLALDLRQRKAQYDKLCDDLARGRSKGAGKGRGRATEGGTSAANEAPAVAVG